jgi:intracellular sulfur oxidation DsrE/DsrF family protein
MSEFDSNVPAPTRAMFLTAGAVGLTLAATACQAEATGVADRAAIEAVLHRPARHKQVIAAPKINGGAMLRYAGNSLDAFQNAFHEGPGTLHVLCVMYGTALLFVANEALWSKYQLFDILDRAGDALPLMVHTPENPFLHSRAATLPPGTPDDAVETLTRRGVSWFVCNNALTGLTRQLAAIHGTDESSVYDDFRHNLLPGALLVPAGVATVILAQEAGFTFLPA